MFFHVLVDLPLWGTSIIGLAVQCADGKYFGSIRTPRNVYDHVLEFLKRTHGRKLREVMDAEVDISDVIHVVTRLHGNTTSDYGTRFYPSVPLELCHNSTYPTRN
jgi:hypothetical protein